MKMNFLKGARARKGGFTLIELLVVIAIIGILSSVVLVSLNTARQKGSATRIQANAVNIRTTLETGFTGSSYPDLVGPAAAGIDTYALASWASTTNLGQLRTDTINNMSGKLQVYDSGCTAGGLTCTNYSITVLSPNGSAFCVDSSGKTATNLTAATAGTITMATTTCPNNNGTI